MIDYPYKSLGETSPPLPPPYSLDCSIMFYPKKDGRRR